MIISKKCIASFLVVLSTTVLYAADEPRPLVVTSEFSEEVPVFHVTKKAENLDVFAQLILVPPSHCYVGAKLEDDCKDEEAFNGLFYAVACMNADFMVNNKFEDEEPPCFTQEDIESRSFIASLGTILKSDQAVRDGDKVYGKVINLLLKMKSKKIDTGGLINQAYLKGVRVTLGDVNFLWKTGHGDSTWDDDRMRKGILLVTKECDRQVDEAIATILDCHCNSPERAKEGIATLLGELSGVSVNGGYALVNLEKVRDGLKESPKQEEEHVSLGCSSSSVT